MELKISLSNFKKIQKETKNIIGFKKEIEKGLSKNITELLSTILSGAIALNVSDIHFEPQKKETGIRVRIDGILQPVIALEQTIYQGILSRFKFLSGIKLNITNRPQDGRFSVSINPKEKPVEIRVSTLPSEYGESTVLRVLNPTGLMSLESLGLKDNLLKLLEKEIKKPNGMIVVTGPTGSGKTTTLYAFLKKIQGPGIKIITIEDPIEYHLKGISQTQVASKKGYDFANGLKSIMRQDPDVILVGEIRDLETAKIGLQAALTGHLVLTTLHAKDAVGAVARLINLGAKPLNIAPAINMIIAQRLVRKVCPKCVKSRSISLEELKKFKQALKGLPRNYKIPVLKTGFKIPEVKGCSSCNHTGYQNRIGIFEILPIDEEIEKLISTGASTTILKKIARKKELVSIKQDGLIKVLEGVTTLEEVERIIGEL